jgi:hypothetical protein
VIIISISQQMLYQRRKTGVWYNYPISTACCGTGNIRDSFQTPTGKHRIFSKIGHGMPILTAFSAREPITIYNPETDDPEQDWILSRILWLEGMQTGINKRGKVDTKSRYIYIHGTHEEDKIGQPASHGCIRMRNQDILELFIHAHEREIVQIQA